MTAPVRVLILGLLLVAVVGVLLAKRAPTPPTPPASVPAVKPLPRLLELGSTSCVPCKAMAPILAEVRRAYAGKLVVETVDVRKDAEAGARYGVEAIPTQVILDADGKELFRHVGFYAKEDLTAKLDDLGIRP